MMTSERGGTVAERVVALVTPILGDLGLELYDCEFGGGVLRVTADKPGGVDLDELALVTRLVSQELDHDDFVPGRYTLEVSSPGLERPLRSPEHFRWAHGRDIVVRLHESVGTLDRRVAGRVLGSDTDGVDVEITDGPLTGSNTRLAFADIERARSVFVWQAAAKPGGPKKAKGARVLAGAASELAASGASEGSTIDGDRDALGGTRQDAEFDDDELADDELADDEFDDDGFDAMSADDDDSQEVGDR